ncbi:MULTISPECIES: hypothetical protein [Asticcacaulis]|jgi:hypothetical protein|nr:MULTISPECIES: hypothetical protein [Asticcacaulis]MDC7674554.1 hypothetical protein [Asticcacaulis machinosus]WAC49120.1 hypothetical protein OVA03_04175 [Asticcacaulis sp. SL142]WKL56910.1 hypothetical protein Q1W73_14745 [Asticcacaulis sp. ZE23SCel15]
MKLTATTLLLCLLSAALVIGSLFGYARPLPFLSEHKYWLMSGGWAVLFLGFVFKGE